MVNNNVPMLGDEVVDKITGFSGILCAVSKNLHSCDRGQVQTRTMFEGKPVEPKWFDLPMLSTIQAGAVEAMPNDLNECTVDLGDEVRDPISGFSGVATSRGVWITGCIRFGITPKTLKKDGDLIEDYWFSWTQLEITKKGNQPSKEEKKFVPEGFMGTAHNGDTYTDPSGKRWEYVKGAWKPKPGGPGPRSMRMKKDPA